MTKGDKVEVTSIHDIDFQNFKYPWTKDFGFGEKTFDLKNGKANLSDGISLHLQSLSYGGVAIEYDEHAQVEININDGNANYTMLYVFAFDKNQLKLLESFEFGEDNIYFRASYAAHGELVIERYIQQAGDAECCPSTIEISYYRWQKGKYVLQGEPQKVPNGYVERIKIK